MKTSITLRLSVDLPDGAGAALAWWNDMHDKEANPPQGLVMSALTREAQRSVREHLARVMHLYEFHLKVQAEKEKLPA